MYQVTKIIRFCYGHRLLNYEGKCRHLHGHNGKVEIELTSDKLDKRGMVRDFEEIKRTIQQWIDTTLDHTMLLQKDDPLVATLRAKKERFYLMDTNPTAEAIAKLIFDHAQDARFPVAAVRLWETDNSFATYTPSRTHRRTHREPHRVRRTSTAADSIPGSARFFTRTRT